MTVLHLFNDDELDAGRASCRVCGCADDHACYRPDLGLCSWAEDDLCSHCSISERQRTLKRRWRLAFAVVAGVWAAIVALTLLAQFQRPHLRTAPPAAAVHTITIPPGVRGAPWRVLV